MKLYEVFAVEGEECAVLKSRIFQNLFVWNCSIRPARVVRGQNIMTQLAERFYSGNRIPLWFGKGAFLRVSVTANGMTVLAVEVISTRLLSLLFGGTRMVGIFLRDSYLNIYNEYPKLMLESTVKGWS